MITYLDDAIKSAYKKRAVITLKTGQKGIISRCKIGVSDGVDIINFGIIDVATGEEVRELTADQIAEIPSASYRLS